MQNYRYNCCKNIHDLFDCLDITCFKKYYKKKCDQYAIDNNVVRIEHTNNANDENSDDSDYDDWVIKNIYYKT